MARRLAWGAVGAVLFVALFADCLAADRPLVVKLDGETYWFPNVIDYAELEHLSGFELRERMDEGDWAIWTPVRHGPTNVRSDGELRVLAEPSGAHWLGTDDRGRDVLARLIHGARTTALVAVGAAALALLFGALLAMLAAWRGGVTDAMVVGFCDVIGAVPALLVIVAAQGLIGRGSLGLVIVLIALPRIADIARIARGALASALVEPYCDAARAIGVGGWQVVARHAMPQVRGPLLVAAGLTAVTAVLGEAALSFLGFGAPSPTASWGELLKQAHENGLMWWLVIAPGVAIAVVSAALGALSQGRAAAD